jgi:predicted SAM-dependent methyltransferase
MASKFKKTLKKIFPRAYSVGRILRNRYVLFGQLTKAIIGKKIWPENGKIMVNIGGGEWYKKRWKVLDFQGEWYSFNRHFIDYNYDLTSKESFPFEKNTVSLYYSEHTLEHIDDDCISYVFSEIFRTLKPGGGFRIAVPDMDSAHEKYRQKNQAFFEPWMDSPDITLGKAFMILFSYPDENFNEQEMERNFIDLGKEEFFDLYTKRLKQDKENAGRHINWFNHRKLEKMLKMAGFGRIYKSTDQKSEFLEMRGGEFDTRPSWSLFIEAVK